MNRREIHLAAAIAALHPRLFLQAKQTRAVTTADRAELTLAQASTAVRRGTVTSRDLTQACLDRIATENPRVNAVISVMSEAALAQAASLDAEARTGKFRSPLHGIPIAIKDAIDTAGTRTTAGSALFENRVPTEDAHVVRLLRQAGAVILAKSNLAEFSLTATAVSSHFGMVHNPWALDRVAGGSSGGSAAAVSTGMCFAALGTDSGGSVRIPAAWCSIVGLKPTAGLVSNSGVIPSVSILDSCGPMGRTVEDVALLFDQMVGYDALDVLSIDRPAEDYAVTARQPVSQLRIGIPRRPFFDDLDVQTARCVEDALTVIAKLAYSLKDVVFSPAAEFHDPIINAAEIYAYHRLMFEQHADLYTPGTRNVLQWCVRYLDDPAQGTASAKLTRYIQARADLERRRRTVDMAFTDFDVLLLPTTKSLPPTIQAAMQAENGASSVNRSLVSIQNTLVFNVLGLPAVTVPCGFSAEGWPVGLMICGPRFSEGRLLAVASAYEQSTPWHERLPARAP